MADAQSNIKVSIDTTDALASIKNLQRQISAFHTSVAKGGAAANAVTAGMQQNLINSINATGKFSAQMKTIRTTTESFTNSLEKNKFSLGEYFRYAGGASKSFGRLFKSEFETINKVARENVKDLQTQYIKMGRDANGAMKAIAVRPLSLDMNDLATKTMIASEKQALLNQLLKQGSTNLLNFGKNTQWAGRQLMVGFTIPLVSLGTAASKVFMDMETQAIRFKKVYGDLFTPQEETKAALEGITELGKEFTKYGVAVSATVGLASEAAAAGFKGLDLQRQTAAATKLSILGQVESQKALETTIALQNAFSMSSEDLATNIDFLNAVENQTVLSLDDMSTAIPKAAPVVQQLGGDVKDLAFFMTAMKEGGINASEGANALKSGLASLINPTGKAAAMLDSLGINVKKIVVDNKGDLKKTVIDFATALNQLDPLNRAQAIEQMFGKFQFARLSTLFANVTKEGTQASRVLDLAGSSIQDLAALSEKELGMTADSAMIKFKASVENLKLSLVPVGEEFLKAVTPIAEFVAKLLDKFNNLGEGTKKFIVVATTAIAGLGPVLLMTFGLLANGVANIIKGFVALKSLFNKTGQSSATLGTEVKYMTLEQRNAAAVAASLDQVHTNLAQTFTAEASAVDSLTRSYLRAIAAQQSFMPTGVPMGRGPVTKRANGKPAVVGGMGNKDTELALLTPGETVIPKDMSKKYGGLINGMIADNIPGYSVGKPGSNIVASHIEGLTPSQLVSTLSDPIMRRVLEALPDATVGLQTLSTTADGMVTVSRTVETSLKNLSDSLSEKNIQDVTAIGTGGFAGTTIEASSERNLMLNAAGIAGDPITFEQMQEARNKAQSYIDRPVKNETDAVKAQRQEAQKLIQEQLEFEQSLVGLSQKDVEAKKADFTKTKTTQALEYSLRQKGLSASEASTLAKQQIADAEKATLKLVQGSKTELEKRKIKEAAYQATLLKEMGLVAGYDEKNTKTTVFNKTQLNAVTRDMAKGQVQFGTPYKAGEEVPQNIYDENGKVVQKGAAVFGSGKSFKGLSGGRISRNQSAVIDASIRDDYYADRNRAKDSFKNGSENGKAYNKGVQSANVPDIYESSRERNSPHPLAPKDGKDDARAYSEAKNKEIKRQSGRTYRAASRPQGAPVQEVVPGKRVRRGASRSGGTVGAGGIIIPVSTSTQQVDDGEMFGPRRPTTFDKTAGSVAGRFRGKFGSIGNKLSGRGAGMGLATAGMLASSMLPGKMGDLAQKISMLGFAFSALKPMIMGLVAVIGAGPMALIAVAGLLAFGIFKLNKSAEEAAKAIQESAKKEAEARYGSSRAIEQFGNTFNKALPSAREFSRNNKQSIAASGTKVNEFAKDYASKGNISTQVINQAALQGQKSGIAAAAMDVAQKAAIFGLSPDEIAANIKAAADLIGADQVKVKLAVQKLLSPDGKDILKEPLTIKSRMEFLNKDNKKQIESINKSIVDVSNLGNVSKPKSIGQTLVSNTATGTAVGGVAGSAIPVVGTGAGAIAGFTAGLISSIPSILNASEANKQYKDSQDKIQSATVQLSVGFMQQKESLALLNAQYADGIITEAEYDAQRSVSISNFDALEKSSMKLVNELRKIDSTGELAAAAVEDLGNQALATLKKSNPALFKKISDSLKGIKNSSKIAIYMAYAQGSLTIMDLAKIPALIKAIDGKSATVALRLISKAGLSEGGESFMNIPTYEAKIKEINELLKAGYNSDLIAERNYYAKKIAQAKKAEADAGKVLPTGGLDTDTVDKYKDVTDGTNNAKSAKERYLEVLQKEIDALKAKRDAQKDANDEVQRQIDLEMKLQDLANQAVQAKISGNYIQAAMLGQQAQNERVKFDKETELRKKDAEIAALQARYNAIKDGASLTKAELAKTPKKANGGLIKGPGTGRSDSIRATLGYAGGGSIRVSNGEFVVRASSVRDYGLNAMNAVNNGTANIDTNSGSTVYNINMPITSNNANPEGVANEVMRRLKVELNKNNKSNSVRT